MKIFWVCSRGAPCFGCDPDWIFARLAVASVASLN